MTYNRYTSLRIGHPMCKLVAAVHKQAEERYRERYDEDIYLEAAKDCSAGLANMLISDAMALCGSPHYRVSQHHWGLAAKKFLTLFI